jgi:hypothetical protein
MFKIQLENGELYKSKSGRVQHYRSTEKAEAKIKKLGDISTGATIVESKARTVALKTENPEDIATKVPKIKKAKKVSTKVEKPDENATAPGEFVTDAEAAKVGSKGKKTKKNKKT